MHIPAEPHSVLLPHLASRRSFKALKQLVKVYYKAKKYKEMMDAYRYEQYAALYTYTIEARANLSKAQSRGEEEATR